MSRFPSRKTFLWIAATGILLIAACIVMATRSRSRGYYTDAVVIREPIASASPRDTLWQPPRLLPASISSDRDEYEPAYTADGLMLWFVRGKAGENADIYTARRTAEGWEEPQSIASINSNADELGPHPSWDGASLYFYSNREGGAGGYDVWVARRGQEGWQEPTNLGPAINTEFNEYNPAPSPDGRALYFASNKPLPGELPKASTSAWSATLREEFYRRPYDIYVALLDENGAKEGAPVASLNTPANEGSPCISPVGDFLYFASDRAGGAGGFDLYRARLIGGVPQAPELLDQSINSIHNELDPALTMDGFALAFSSDRPKGKDGSGTAREYGVYCTSSREVFREWEKTTNTLAWAATWKALWPNLAYAMLSLLAALVLLKVWKYSRGRRLSLLVRCLLISAFAHLLVVMLMNFWEVTTSIASAVRGGSGEGGGIRVSLSPTVGTGSDGLYTQIRGNFTDIAAPASQRTEVGRRSVPDVAPPTSSMIELAAAASPLPTDAPLAALSTVVDATALPPPLPATRTSSSVPSSQTPPKTRIAVPVGAAPVAGDESSPAAPDGATLVVGRADAGLTTAPRIGLPSASVDIAPPPSVVADERGPGLLAGTHVSDAKAAPPTPASSISSGSAALAGAGNGEPSNLAVRTPVPEQTGAAVVDENPSGGIARPVTTGSARSNASLPASTPAFSEVRSGGLTAPTMSGDMDGGASMANPAAPRDAAVASSSLTTGMPALSGSRLALPKGEALALRSPSVEPTAPAGSQAPEAEASPAPAATSTFAKRASLPPASATGTNLSADFTPRSSMFSGPSAAETVEPMALSGGWTAKDSSATAPLPNASAASGERAATAATATPGPALLTLSLPQPLVEAPSPDPPVQPIEPIGRIEGRVRDSISGNPLANASVQLDLLDSSPLTSMTDAAGRYAMEIPRMPDNFAITASMSGYVPSSQNVPVRRLKRGVLAVDFALEPITSNVFAMDATPDVHHLGNDRFEGAINSQFQKQAEGVGFVAQFDVAPGQMPSEAAVAELRLMAKGVQCPPRIDVNGRRLRYDFEESPADGGFGEKAIRFEARLLKEGANTIEISTTACRGDLDDFEFVNVQVRLYKSW